MKAGDLVGKIDTPLCLGLVLKVYYGRTFTEAKIFWFNVKTACGKNVIEFYAPRFLNVLS
jgi:hypothetical protein